MPAQRVFKTLQARFSSMASRSKDSSTLEEQEQKPTGTFDNDDIPVIDKRKERQLVRKLDLYIVPVVMLLYLFSFLDRLVVFQTLTLNSPALTTQPKSQHRQCKALRPRSRPRHVPRSVPSRRLSPLRNLRPL